MILASKLQENVNVLMHSHDIIPYWTPRPESCEKLYHLIDGLYTFISI